MGSRIHWELCRKYGIKCEDKWFNHVPSTVCSNDNGNIELFWNKEINLGVAENRPDVIVVDKEEKKWTLIDFSVPFLFLTCLESCVLQSCFVGFGDPSGVVVRLR